MALFLITNKIFHVFVSDLADGGATHFAETVTEIKKRLKYFPLTKLFIKIIRILLEPKSKDSPLLCNIFTSCYFRDNLSCSNLKPFGKIACNHTPGRVHNKRREKYTISLPFFLRENDST